MVIMKTNQSKYLKGDEFYNTLKANLRPEYLVDPTISEFITKYIETRSVGQSSKACGITLADGNFLFNQKDVYECIERLTKQQVIEFGFDAAEVVERTKEIAFFDPVALVNEDGTYIKNLRDIPDEARRALKSLKVKNIYEEDMNGVPQYKGEIIEYSFWDKTKTLELMGREKGVFKKTTVVEHDVSKNAKSYLLASLTLAETEKLALDAPSTPKDAKVIDVTPKPIPKFKPLSRPVGV